MSRSPVSPVCCALVGALFAQAAVAQGPLAAGYTASVRYAEVQGWPALNGVAAARDGKIYVGIWQAITEIDPAGNTRELFLLPSFRQPGILALPGGGDTLYFSESTTTNLYRHHLPTGTQQLGSLPANAFDLVMAPTGELLVSAFPGWPIEGNRAGVWLVDFDGGAHRELITVSGPSGPLAFDDNGDLYYAEQSPIYPTPPGSVRVLRFAAADVQRAIAGGPRLSAADAVGVLGGLDGAYDLLFDDRGRLLISDPQNGDVLRTRPSALQLEATPLLGRPSTPYADVVLQMAFVDDGAATFDPWQPATGSRLLLFVTDFMTRAEIHAVTPQRPTLMSSRGSVIRNGPFDLTLTGMPALGVALLCASGAPTVPERILLAPAGVPLWSSLDWTAPVLCAAVGIDAAGNASVRFSNGPGQGVVQVEAIGVEPATLAFGSAPALSLTLR